VLHQEEEQVSPRRHNSRQAIALAMEGRWREAVAVNRGIIEDFPNDADAFNRLGRAYMELGEYAQARGAYQRTKELDPYNAIAEKNLRRLSHLKETAAAKSPPREHSHRVEPRVFIEETGKAGVVNLHRLAPKEVLAEVVAGDSVNLRIDDSSLIVEDTTSLEYLGRVEPRYSQRLIKLMNGGNRYAATVISSSESHLTIIIREVYQHPSQAGQLSFPAKGLSKLKPFFSPAQRQLHYESVAEEPELHVEAGEEEEEEEEEPFVEAPEAAEPDNDEDNDDDDEDEDELEV
jgi:tetratricopeptide (TPR) repeat protein